MLNWTLGLSLAVVCLLVVLVLAFIVVGAWAFGHEPHRSAQRCPQCGRRATPGRQRTEEAGGARSFTDAIEVEYTCPRGHTFTKKWTVALPGQ